SGRRTVRRRARPSAVPVRAVAGGRPAREPRRARRPGRAVRPPAAGRPAHRGTALDRPGSPAVVRLRHRIGSANRTGVGDMNELDAWTEAACRALGLDRTVVDRTMVLDLARDVAHNVLRPGAPLTTYLLGVAVGRGADAGDAAARLADLARAWPAARGPEGGSEPAAGQRARPGRSAVTCAPGRTRDA